MLGLESCGNSPESIDGEIDIGFYSMYTEVRDNTTPITGTASQWSLENVGTQQNPKFTFKKSHPFSQQRDQL
jgi:hypothetical protein